jgi:hypothetical protein
MDRAAIEAIQKASPAAQLVTPKLTEAQAAVMPVGAVIVLKGW